MLGLGDEDVEAGIGLDVEAPNVPKSSVRESKTSTLLKL